MTKSRPHGFIAGLSDFYLVSLLVNVVLGFWVSFSQRSISPSLVLFGFLVSVTAAILYHRVLSKRVLWLSPGEYLAGRIIQSGTKEWVNPYGRNRWALFSVTLLTIILSGNAWDWIGEGRVYPWSKVLGTMLQTALVFLGAVLMGKGALWGVWFPVVIFGLGSVMARRAPGPEELKVFASWAFGFLVVVTGSVAFAYHFIRKTTEMSAAK